MSQIVHLENGALAAVHSHQLRLRKSASDLLFQLVMSLSWLYCLEENGDNFSNIKLPFNVERRGSTVLNSHNQQRVRSASGGDAVLGTLSPAVRNGCNAGAPGAWTMCSKIILTIVLQISSYFQEIVFLKEKPQMSR